MLNSKTLNVILRMNDLIYRRQTGNSYEFAEKLGKSRSSLFVYLNIMRTLGAPIAYCPYSRSYYYVEKGRFKIGFSFE